MHPLLSRPPLNQDTVVSESQSHSGSQTSHPTHSLDAVPYCYLSHMVSILSFSQKEVSDKSIDESFFRAKPLLTSSFQKSLLPLPQIFRGLCFVSATQPPPMSTSKTTALRWLAAFWQPLATLLQNRNNSQCKEASLWQHSCVLQICCRAISKVVFGNGCLP